MSWYDSHKDYKNVQSAWMIVILAMSTMEVIVFATAAPAAATIATFVVESIVITGTVVMICSALLQYRGQHLLWK